MADKSPPTVAKAVAKRQKDDREFHKARLIDKTFDANHYPDPLVHRPSPDPNFKAPAGITEEMTERWLSMIREASKETAIH